MHKRIAPSAVTDDLNICCDVGMDQIYLACPPLDAGSFGQMLIIDNRTDAIRKALEQVQASASEQQRRRLRIVMEPTGIYYKLLIHIAREMGFRTALVNAEHVVKMRTVLFGDDGKTDRRDPLAIAAVADRGRLILDRVLPESYQLLRGWSSLLSARRRWAHRSQGARPSSIERALSRLRLQQRLSLQRIGVGHHEVLRARSPSTCYDIGRTHSAAAPTVLPDPALFGRPLVGSGSQFVERHADRSASRGRARIPPDRMD